ncbi:carbon monoxide dehydrogenase/acetyl-CoA synthase methytransferase subunit [Faecousia intestinalis]|jgi:acetyl-CoA decarbonylase/synthase complex subunit gamma|uniref:carbon monoxide dehydrogenase/acetyl-CoA synthase methytransferase subunit n=1 Tax=Faecousia intestinalis TaxID=3133167 RepID=UPI003F491B0C
MALKGLDIFKLSPKKNCKECGSPTCMAFCMKVAQGAVALDKCPYFSEEAKAKLSEATAPPMKTITVGNDIKLGGETVLFRHEKTLVNRNRFAVPVCTCMDEAAADQKLADIQKVDYERIGEREYIEFVMVRCEKDSADKWEDLVKKAAATGRTLILNCTCPECAKKALAICKDGKPILNGATPENFEEMSAIATEAGVTLGVHADSLSELHDLIAKLEAAGNKNLIIDVTGKTVKETFANTVLVRRTALKDGDRTFGYPSIVDLAKLAAGDEHLETALAAVFTLKYGSIIVMERLGYAEALPLYGLRQNVFTDPQKPMKVAPGIYPMNGATPDDPCMLTVDFALTYFLVSGEIERSNVPVNLLITDASGMSVLTAWAAGKFSSSSIKKFFDEFELDKKINNRTLVIPGKVAVMKGEIQDKLPDWNVVVGTREAVEIVKFLKDGEHIKAAEAVAATKKPKEEKKEVVDADAPIDYSKLVIPEIPHKDLGVTYKQRNVESKKFVTIGERIHCISPVIREAMATFNPDPILERAAQQIKAGATYLDVNIGPAESNGPELMTWAVKLLQENFNNVPLALDTANKKAIEAGIRVYNRTNGKPIVNSADAGSRISNIDLAAANDAIVIALCSADGIAKDNDERMHHCHTMLDRGMALGMEAEDLWFDPLFLVVKGMQDKQMDVLNAIKLFADEGLKSTGGLSNNSNGAPKTLRPIMDSALVAMAMMQGLTSAIVNPNDLRLMETIKSCDIFKNNELYSDSYLEI